jgi:polysaccharide deacetylase family protein (PEP-CTERM system associated)
MSQAPIPQAPTQSDLLTVAVEDYFQVVAFRKLIRQGQWYRFERRVELNTRKALALLDEFGVKATFFALGWIADKMPELIREIADRGHEVASKGYYHRTIGEMMPAEFREDLIRSREAIERASGQRVWGYRIARGHLGVADLWALDTLAEEGFAYDSSFYPRLRSLAREPWRRFPHTHRHAGRELVELPLSTWQLGPWLVPIAGGNYLRQSPHSIMKRAIGQWHRSFDHPFVMYFHVWELDPDLPRITAAPIWTRMRQYRNLAKMPSILRHYLSNYRFRPIRDHLGLGVESAQLSEETGEGLPRAAVVAKGDRLPISIVVPCYNEESVLPYLENTLEHLVAELADAYELTFIFVDDGSSDATWSVLQSTFSSLPNCRFERHEENHGVAAAILTGIRAAKTEVIGSIDCDCTYDPHQLRELIPRLEEGVSLVTASPYHPSGRVLNVPGWRLLLSKGLSALYRRVTRQKLHTYTSCFRVYRRSALLDLPVRERGFLGVAEMLGSLDQRGDRIVEHPAVLEVRMLGHSKMKLLPTIYGHLRLLSRMAAARWLGHAPAGRNERRSDHG